MSVKQTWLILFNMSHNEEQVTNELLGKIEGTQEEAQSAIYAQDPSFGWFRERGLWEYGDDGSMTLYVEYPDNLRNSYVALPLEEVKTLEVEPPLEDSKYTYVTLCHDGAAPIYVSDDDLAVFDLPSRAMMVAKEAAIDEVRNLNDGDRYSTYDLKVTVDKGRMAVVVFKRTNENTEEILTERIITRIRRHDRE